MAELKNPIIGKNVIETLTTGMYDDSRYIYREYIQNAADQIDVAVEDRILNSRGDGCIGILIDANEKRIVIEDNATGIKTDNVAHFLGDIAKSEKDPETQKGFRGIGRLGGLGYCETLIFETSYLDEPVKSIITMNAKLLKKLLEDKKTTLDAASVISLITNVEKEKEDKNLHYFKVTLNGVTNPDLLNDQWVIDYLSMVAPVPFAEEFTLRENITKFFADENIKIDEYNVVNITINKQNLYKAYRNEILDKNKSVNSKVVGVGFFKVRNPDKELIAIGWYGISTTLNKKMSQNNTTRGIRIRKDNITIGDENTLNTFFPEERFNHHYVGEVHVLGSGFKPNARRDYFNDSKTVSDFHSGIKERFKLLTKLIYDCSGISNRLKEVLYFKEKYSDFDGKNFTNRSEEAIYNNDKSIAIKASEKLNEYKSRALESESIRILFSKIVEENDINIDDDSVEQIKSPKKNYLVDELFKLELSERKLVLDIFGIIDEVIEPSKSIDLQRKIVEKLIKNNGNEKGDSTN